MLRMPAGKRYCGEGVEDSVEAMRFTEIIKEALEVSDTSNKKKKPHDHFQLIDHSILC